MTGTAGAVPPAGGSAMHRHAATVQRPASADLPGPAEAGTPNGRRSGPRLALRHRLAERGIDRILLLLVPGALFLVVLFIYPFLYGLGLSFQPLKGGGPLANYRTFFTDTYQREDRKSTRLNSSHVRISY